MKTTAILATVVHILKAHQMRVIKLCGIDYVLECWTQNGVPGNTWIQVQPNVKWAYNWLGY